MTNEEMVVCDDAFECGIQKSLIYPGKTPIDYEDGTKIYYRYKTIVKDDGTVIDDSKKLNPKKPMGLIVGKKFKLEIWEKALKTMRVGEVSKFSVIKDLLYEYPLVAKQLREYYKSNECKSTEHDHDHDHGECKHKAKSNDPPQRTHCCGFNILEHGIGYPDLDELIKNPKALDFIFEIVKVELPGEYKKDSWSLDDKERTNLIPKLKEEGNELFKLKKYKEASERYYEAIGYLEQFMMREKPNDVDWLQLNDQKVPILLNYCLCKYHMNDFYSCIEHTSTILEHQPNNVKALFRRAKAYIGVWSPNEARQDLNKCIELDKSLLSECNAQLDYISKMEIKYNKEQAEKFKGRLFS